MSLRNVLRLQYCKKLNSVMEIKNENDNNKLFHNKIGHGKKIYHQNILRFGKDIFVAAAK
jgi:hypothetical protein